MNFKLFLKLKLKEHVPKLIFQKKKKHFHALTVQMVLGCSI